MRPISICAERTMTMTVKDAEDLIIVKKKYPYNNIGTSKSWR